MSNIVYAKVSSVLAHSGQRVRISAGEPWDSTDPLVDRYPDMFVTHVPGVRCTTDPRGYREYEPEVERATRAPGERRSTKRTPAKGAETDTDD